MFAGNAGLQLVTVACKPVAPADAVIYIDALGFTAKKATSTAHLHQPTKPEGTGYSLREREAGNL